MIIRIKYTAIQLYFRCRACDAGQGGLDVCARVMADEMATEPLPVCIYTHIDLCLCPQIRYRLRLGKL